MQYFILIAKNVAICIYFFMKLLLPKCNKVVMISRFNMETSIDFKLLKEEIKRTSPKTKVVILNHKFKNRFYLLLQVLIEMFHIATSSSCIIDSYVIPVSILKHRKNLIIIQIWHALGAIKKFGYSILDLKEGSSRKTANIFNMHKGYTYIISGSEEMVPFYKEAFNVDRSIIKPYGLPRIDYLLNKNERYKNIRKIISTYPELISKKNILYAPTFRKKAHIKIEDLIKKIDFTKYNLIIKQHHLDKTKQVLDSRVIYDTTYNTYELFSVTDYVISDYSAVFFEAAIMEIPMFFYVYDIDKYKERRGLFINIDNNMPGFVSKSAKKIIEAIEDDNYDLDKIREFKQKYVSNLDGTSTKKIVSLLKLGGVYEK
jgi:CDP-ribitol ribitolphosphotransferase